MRISAARLSHSFSRTAPTAESAVRWSRTRWRQLVRDGGASSDGRLPEADDTKGTVLTPQLADDGNVRVVFDRGDVYDNVDATRLDGRRRTLSGASCHAR